MSSELVHFAFFVIILCFFTVNANVTNENLMLTKKYERVNYIIIYLKYEVKKSKIKLKFQRIYYVNANYV